jgi:hypothetical protein
MTLALVVDGELQSPAQLNARIICPLKLIKSVALFFDHRRSQESPPPLGNIIGDFSPCRRLRRMFPCVATACRRLATAPAGVHVMYRTTGRWAARVMERVTRGRVKKVQVLLQRRACCAVRCACRASACVRCVFDACCSKRWQITRSVAAHQARLGVDSFAQAAAAARVAGGPNILKSTKKGDGVSVLCHAIGDADGVNTRDVT